MPLRQRSRIEPAIRSRSSSAKSGATMPPVHTRGYVKGREACFDRKHGWRVRRTRCDAGSRPDRAAHAAQAQESQDFASWKARFGLGGTALPGEDADGDGRTNQEEFEAGTHPRGFFTRYFAEGASTAFFESRLALLNPGTSDVIALLRFETGDGRAIRHSVTVPAKSRRTVDAQGVPGLAPAEFSTTIEADGVLVADRLMTWGARLRQPRGDERAVPGRTWYLAEGATHSGLRPLLPAAERERRGRRVEVAVPAARRRAADRKRYSVGAA